MAGSRKTLFIFLGFFGLAFAGFDFGRGAYFDSALLSTGWALVFFNLAMKDSLKNKLGKTAANVIQAVVVVFLITAGILKLMFMLGKL